MRQPERLFGRLIVITLLAFSLARLVGLVIDTGLHSIQADYAAFYTAGQAANAGLSPYRNHIDHVPPIWDGIGIYTPSPFLYPPLVATLFRPLALLPYTTSKVIWSLTSLLAMLAAVVLSARHTGLPRSQTAIALGLVGLFHPVLTEIERGQIDGIILLLLIGAIILMQGSRRWRDLLAGCLFALAVLLKLHTLFLLPFLLMRRRWQALAGVVLGGLLLIGGALMVNGPQQLRSYVTIELPRINRYGIEGDRTMMLPDSTIASLRSGVADDSVAAFGRMWSRELFGFRRNGSVARGVASVLSQAGVEQDGIAVVSAGLLLALILIVVIYVGRSVAVEHLVRTKDSIFWQVALLATLMSGPMTWSMNLVWLLPAIVVVVGEFRDPVGSRRSRGEAVSLYLIVLGLVMAGMPDDRSFALWLPMASPFFSIKNILAELVAFAGMLGYLKHHREASA